MGVNEIKQEIGNLERSIEAQQQNLNKLRQRITDEIKPFVKPLLKENVEKEVRGNSEHTKGLGREKLSAMKQELKALVYNSDSLVEKVLANNDFWMHINYDIGDERYMYGVSREEVKGKIYRGIKIILGEAGKLLIEYDYVKAGITYQWDDTHRNFNLVDSGQKKSNLLYKGHFPTPNSLKLLTEEYAKGLGILHELYEKVSDLKKELSEQEAADLWDEA